MVGAVGVEGHLLPGPGAADAAVLGVAHGDGQGGARGADGGRAHAELAGGDPADGQQEPLAPVAQAAAELAVVRELSVLRLQQGAAGEGDAVEGGEAVVHRAPAR